MSNVTAKRALVSIDEYLAGERSAEVRHEYVGGRVYAMVGVSDRHGLIAGNIHAALHPYARAAGCQLFIADMKVRLQIAGDDVFYYPDVLLACDPQDRETYYRTRPCLIVEVLSEATERIDRREKFLAYRTLDSLREYVLVSQDQRLVEVFRRESGWREELLTGGVLRLGCLNMTLALETIYEGVE
jgi:Uma2 family endonuclease